MLKYKKNHYFYLGEGLTKIEELFNLFGEGRTPKQAIGVGYASTTTYIAYNRWKRGEKPRHHDWNGEEIEILKQNFEKMKISDLQRLLPRHPWCEVFHKGRKLGLYRGQLKPPNETKLTRNEASDAEKGFVAGIIEGEGTLSAYHKKSRWKGRSSTPTISIANTKRELIEFVQTIMGGMVQRGERSGVVPCYRLYIHTAPNVLNVLTKLRPYFVSKKRQCELLIELCNIILKRKGRPPIAQKEVQIIEELHQLNKRGLGGRSHR